MVLFSELGVMDPVEAEALLLTGRRLVWQGKQQGKGRHHQRKSQMSDVTESHLTSVNVSWFPATKGAGRCPGRLCPSATTAWLDRGSLLPEMATGHVGTARHAPSDLDIHNP
jgi:hypothetical protein